MSEILSTTLLGIGEKHIETPPFMQLETLTSLKTSEISKITADQISGPSFVLQGADPSDFAPTTFDAEQLEFYAQDIDIFSKLPLAALVYVIFDFFFFNARQVTDKDMYIYDEDTYLDETEGDTPEKIMTFVGQNVFRVVAALVITWATVLTSKMTYHPHF